MTLAMKVRRFEADLVNSINTNLFLMSRLRFFSQCLKKTSTVTMRVSCINRSQMGYD